MFIYPKNSPGLVGVAIILAVRGVRRLRAYYVERRDRRRSRSENAARTERT